MLEQISSIKHYRATLKNGKLKLTMAADILSLKVSKENINSIYATVVMNKR